MVIVFLGWAWTVWPLEREEQALHRSPSLNPSIPKQTSGIATHLKYGFKNSFEKTAFMWEYGPLPQQRTDRTQERKRFQNDSLCPPPPPPPSSSKRSFSVQWKSSSVTTPTQDGVRVFTIRPLILQGTALINSPIQKWLTCPFETTWFSAKTSF